MGEKRSYQKVKRAEDEQATGEAILNAAYEAFSRDVFDRVTLRQIADDSGVTVQTVIRRFGSKEQLFERLAERETARVVASRQVDEALGFDAALDALLAHYEKDGDVVLNFIAQEHLFEPIGKIVAQGRVIHRKWAERHCRHILDGTEGTEREHLLAATTVATDLGTWKLLRRDLGLDSREVAAVMKQLLDGLQTKD